MIELLRDSIWTFIGAAIALAAVIVMVMIYFWQRERKRLLVESVASVPLLALGRKGIEGLELSFNKNPLNNATIHVVRVSSIGNRPILSQDFESPLRLTFDDEAAVLAADIIGTKPCEIPVEISTDGNSATLTRHLLNPGDEVMCRLLVKDSKKQFKVQGRIAGIKMIERSRATSLFPAIAMVVSAGLIIGGFLLSPNPKSSGPSDIRAEELPYLISILVGFVIMAISSTMNLLASLRKLLEKRLLGRVDNQRSEMSVEARNTTLR